MLSGDVMHTLHGMAMCQTSTHVLVCPVWGPDPGSLCSGACHIVSRWFGCGFVPSAICDPTSTTPRVCVHSGSCKRYVRAPVHHMI